MLAAVAASALALDASGSAGVKATIAESSNATLGTIVVNATGRTLYHYTGDHGKTVACTAACAQLWPPLLVAKTAKPVAGKGIAASKLGTLTRPDGTVQVTYDGYTLYRYAPDTKNGEVKGQAIESKWFALAPSGALVKVDPSSSTAAGGANASSGSTSSSGSSGGTTTSGASSGYDY